MTKTSYIEGLLHTLRDTDRAALIRLWNERCGKELGEIIDQTRDYSDIVEECNEIFIDYTPYTLMMLVKESADYDPYAEVTYFKHHNKLVSGKLDDFIKYYDLACKLADWGIRFCPELAKLIVLDDLADKCRSYLYEQIGYGKKPYIDEFFNKEWTFDYEDDWEDLVYEVRTYINGKKSEEKE